MNFKAIFSVLAMAASTALADMNYVFNNCDFDVYVTSVSNITSPTTQVAAGEYYTEGQYYYGTGTAIKITRTQDGLWTNKPVLVFAYTYSMGAPIYYSLSTANGFDFYGDLVQITGQPNDHVPAIVWNGEPGPDGTVVYDGATELYLSLCAPGA